MCPVPPTSRLSDALAALQRGFAVLPLWWMRKDGHCACGRSDCGSPGKHPLGDLVPHGVKDATKDSKKVGKWWAAFPEANIGTACGKISDLIVLDVDPRNGGLKSLEKLQQVRGQLLDTYRVLTPGTKKDGRGRHYYWKYSAVLLSLLKTACKNLDGLDVLADGKQVVSPGSNHKTGLEYEIVGSPIAACEERAFQPGTAAGPKLVPKPAPKPVPAPTEPGTVDAENALADRCKTLRGMTAGRNDYLAKVACWDMGPYVRDNDIAQGRVAAELLSAAEASGLTHQESVATIESGLRGAIEKNFPPEGISDIDLGLKFAERYKSFFRFLHEWGKWMEWQQAPGAWTKDRILHVWTEAKKLCQQEAQVELKSAKQLKSAKTVAAVVKMAQSEACLASVPEDWDSDLWLLNTPAGTVEQKGRVHIREHRREDYITKITPAAPGGECPRWLQFLEEVTLGDKELTSYLKRVAGYCTTGSIREQVLWFLFGSGANGKGTFLRALLASLGEDFAKTVSPETFLEQRFAGHPTDVANLQGTRVIIVPDMPIGKRWAIERIKAFTGGDSISARHMRQDFFNFTPQFKLIFGGNDKPALRGVNDAIRRRLIMIPFRAKFLKEKDDKNLEQKLLAERGGFLQWMLDGCSEWQAHGLLPPKVVTEATENYLEGEDVLTQFIESKCDKEERVQVRRDDKGERYQVRRSDLFHHWKSFCFAVGEGETTQRQFAQMMENSGYRAFKSYGEWSYRNLRLKQESPAQQPSLPRSEEPIEY